MNFADLIQFDRTDVFGRVVAVNVVRALPFIRP